MAENEQTKTKKSKWGYDDLIGYVFGGGIFDRVLKSRRLPLVFLVLVLAVLYITNGYHAYYVEKQNEKLEKEIKELRAEDVATQRELISEKKYGNIQEKIVETGLELENSKTPPFTISMKKEKE